MINIKMLKVKNNKTSVYPKEHQWLNKQKEKWVKNAHAYFCSIADKHDYEKLHKDWGNKCIESYEFMSEWLLNQPSIAYYLTSERDLFHFMHKPLDFGIEALKVVINRYWEILKA